jgi:predicted nucleic acid-binding protein
VLDLDVRIFLDALQGVLAHGLSYWDALIWATAKGSGIGNILTEDQEHLRMVEDIRYLNPFDRSFDMALIS